MTGKVCVSTFPYYDIGKCKMAYKNRPILVIGKADEGDYVVLPISRVTRKENLDSYYDVEIQPEDVPLTGISSTSYIRTHKQQTVHKKEITKSIVDFREEYPKIYNEVIDKVAEFQKKLIKDAKK